MYIGTRERGIIRMIWLEVGHVRERGSSLKEILNHNNKFVPGMTEMIYITKGKDMISSASLKSLRRLDYIQGMGCMLGADWSCREREGVYCN